MIMAKESLKGILPKFQEFLVWTGRFTNVPNIGIKKT